MGTPLSAVEESELVALLLAGEASGFERLVRTFGPPMRTVLRRMLRNDEDADDALQEAFLSAFKAIGRFESKSSLGTWLHRIAVNVALMKLRARKSRPLEAEGVEELLPEFVGKGVFHASPTPWGELPEDPVVQAELCVEVRAAIDTLPEPYRLALFLRDIEELSNEELAQALGVTVNAAKIRVHRARQALRTVLEPRMRSL